MENEDETQTQDESDIERMLTTATAATKPTARTRKRIITSSLGRGQGGERGAQRVSTGSEQWGQCCDTGGRVLAVLWRAVMSRTVTEPEGSQHDCRAGSTRGEDTRGWGGGAARLRQGEGSLQPLGRSMGGSQLERRGRRAVVAATAACVARMTVRQRQGTVLW